MGIIMKRQNRDLNLLVEEAVRSYPLDVVPDGILSGVMGQVRQPAVRFRLSGIDITLSVLLGAVAGVLISLLQQLKTSLYWTARLKMEAILLFQQIRLVLLHHRAEMAAIFSVALTCLLLVFFITWVYRRQPPLPA